MEIYVIPEIPSRSIPKWNAAEYPYALMFYNYNTILREIEYHFWALTAPAVKKSTSNKIECSDRCNYAEYNYQPSYGEWEHLSNGIIGGCPFLGNCIWTNHNILNDDDTVFIPASDPKIDDSYFITDDYFIKHLTLSAIGDAIRVKTGRNTGITPLQMPNEILSIGTDGTLTAEHLLMGYTAYSAGGKITGTVTTYRGQILEEAKDNPIIVNYDHEGV